MALITSSKLYDWAKYTAIVFLPALNLLWLALSTIWGLPYSQQVSATVLALNTFLGAVVGLSSAQHNAKAK